MKIENLILKPKQVGKRISYLVGVIAGDGHLEKDERELIIADGQTDNEKLKSSKEYLELIERLFKEEFNVRSTLKRERTWWRYSIYNKWLNRFLNYYFEIPFGKKSSIIKCPKKLHDKNEKYFWRGIMDTDGFVRENRKQIWLKSNSYTLIEQFKEFCSNNKITTVVKKDRRGYSLRVLTESYREYAKVVGCSHPRKKAILFKYLEEGPKYKVLVKIKKPYKDEVLQLFKYLRPYKKCTYIKLDEYNQKAKKEEIFILLDKLKNYFGVRITEIKRKRYNNQFIVSSKSFTDFVRENTSYDLPWQPLKDHEREKLVVEWRL